jgi:hypothetical protein
MFLIRNTSRFLLHLGGLLLLFLLATTAASAQIPLQAQLVLRPVTPGDIALINFLRPPTFPAAC